MQNNSTKSVVINGSKWLSISTITEAVVQVAKLAILARFITKADFGIVAILNVILGVTLVFADLGFSVGIMSIKDISKRQFSSVFWAQGILFFILYILLSLSSKFIAMFYESPDIKQLIPISLLSLLLWGIGKLYDTLIHKQKQFRTMAIRNIVSSVISLISAYIFCVFGLKIYSLILSTLVYVGIYNIWNFIAGQQYMKLSLYFSFNDVKPYLKIGLFKMGTQVCDFFSDKIDVLIIGKLLGMEVLGLYNIAKELLPRVTNIFKTIISKVSLPIMANINNDKLKLKQYFLFLSTATAYVCAPLCFLFMVFAKDIIIILYGTPYLGAAIYLQLFALLYALNSISSQEGVLVSASGRTDLDFYWTIIRIVLTIPITWVFSYISLNAVILGQYLIGIPGFFYTWKFIINKILNVSMKEYLNSYYREVLIGLVLSIPVTVIVNINILDITNIVLRLIVYGTLFSCVYMALLYVLDRKHTEDIIRLFNSK